MYTSNYQPFLTETKAGVESDNFGDKASTSFTVGFVRKRRLYVKQPV